jgi:hypothetical protein
MRFFRPKHVAYFLTGHGFGHGVRGSAIINALPEDVKVTVFSSLPAGFFREEIRLPPERFELIPCELDCGCIQPDSVRVDVQATLATYAGIHAARESLIAEFSQRLKTIEADAVVGDIAPLAFPIARAAGLPSTAICNFAWTDIYAPYLQGYPDFRPVWDAMVSDYACADRQLRLEPYFGTPFSEWGVPSQSVGMLARQGMNRRPEFAARFDLDPRKKWALVYIGSHGMGGVDWSRLEACREWQFLGLYDLPGAANYRRIEKNPGFSYADLTASVDGILGKLGYGLVTEALAHGKPVLFPGRSDFAEFEMLREEMKRRGLGREIPLESLMALDLESHLAWAKEVHAAPEPAPALQAILKIWGFGPSSQ